MFAHHARISLHQTDAGGRLFFAAQFYLMHCALEEMEDKIGLSVKNILGHPRLTFPIVHTEADYKALLVTGDRVTVEVGVERIGQTSVSFLFIIKKKGRVVAGTGKIVCVCVNKKTWKKSPLPKEWRDKFAKAVI